MRIYNIYYIYVYSIHKNTIILNEAIKIFLENAWSSETKYVYSIWFYSQSIRFIWFAEWSFAWFFVFLVWRDASNSGEMHTLFKYMRVSFPTVFIYLKLRNKLNAFVRDVETLLEPLCSVSCAFVSQRNVNCYNLNMLYTYYY